MAHSKPNKPSPTSAPLTHRELLASLVRAGELSVEWKLVRRKALADPRLPRKTRLEIAAVASRARSECSALADIVIAGMLALVRGERREATRLLRSSERHMAFLLAADLTVAAVIRKSITRARHGN